MIFSAKNKLIPIIVSVFGVSALLCSCSDDNLTSSNFPQIENSKETTHNIVGYVNRTRGYSMTEVVLREVDSTLSQTGVAYHGFVDDYSGHFSLENVKLTQPYVYLEVNGYFYSNCYDNNETEPMTSWKVLEAYADVRKGDSISVNLLTHMQAKRLKRYINRGLSFDSSMSLLQKEISDLFLLDSLHEDFSKMNLSTLRDYNYYLLGVNVLNETYVWKSGGLDELLKEDVLTDSLFSTYWSYAYYFNHNSSCDKFDDFVPGFGYKTDAYKVKEYLNNIWQKKYNLGNCSAENYHEIKATESNKTQFLYCDTLGWTLPRNGCYDLDMIVLNSSVGDTLPGHLTKGTYCTDDYYKWGRMYDGSVGWTKASAAESGVGFACTKETLNRYGKSGRKCYRCEYSYGYYLPDVDMSECDENLPKQEPLK
ncbi:hypothetical protein IE02_0237 [Fibrobacter succinogenes subsp. elongatus]|uniref:Lipoprotein n=1 Tax=Fibrobacter succinogenes TaxID=833 RepID=A0A380RTW1_FIBSU|nr:hypothetical protein IE02_0237 [Fibrobacter succinogenes subsp. elongatus]SUQ19013.1 hypothetical protein SAMN05661053_0237 [Fibrobacter succinogenes]